MPATGKMHVDKLILVSKMKKISILTKYIGTFFFIVNSKYSIDVCFNLLCCFPNLENKILCTLHTNRHFVETLLFSSFLKHITSEMDYLFTLKNVFCKNPSFFTKYFFVKF